MKKSLLKACYVSAVLYFAFPASPCFADNFPSTSSGNTQTALTISAPANLFLATDPWYSAATNVSLGTPAVSQGTVYSVSNNAPSEFPIGITNVTWTVTDKEGNTASAVQTVTVRDTQKPVIVRMFEISVVNDPGQCGAAVQLFTPDTFDNSGEPVTITSDAPAYFKVGSLVITWTATDKYGNSDTSTQLITVIDNEEPTIKTNNISVTTNPGKNFATVNLGTPVTADNCAVVSIKNDAPATFPVGTTLVHWTVTDPVGFTGTSVQTVVVKDAEKPVIASPASVTVNNTAHSCGANISLVKPAAADNCGIASITNNAPAFFPTGTTVVTWTATDVNGNSSSVTQNVTVKDVEAPVFSGVVNATVGCDNTAAIAPVVTDNCSTPVVTYTQTSTRGTDASKTAYYNYVITRTWTAKDASNNTSTAKQTITVTDKTAPLITIPSNISVANDANTCGAVVRYTVTVSDNCSSPVTLTYSKASGATFSIGATTVTVTAKDVSGNISTKTFTVTVTDTRKPTITAPADITTKVSSSTSKASGMSLGAAVTNDNCNVKIVTNNAPSSYPVGVTIITWKVTDAYGNTATDIQTITVTVDSKKRNSVSASASSTEESVSVTEENGSLQVLVAPNPSPDYFTLKLQSRSNAPVNLRVFDVSGRLIDTRSKIGANSNVQVGESYMPGIYFAELIQGKERKVIQLAKIR